MYLLSFECVLIRHSSYCLALSSLIHIQLIKAISHQKSLIIVKTNQKADKSLEEFELAQNSQHNDSFSKKIDLKIPQEILGFTSAS